MENMKHFGYLGFGIILLFLSAIILIFIKKDFKNLKQILKRPGVIALIVAFFLGMLLAMGTSVKIRRSHII